jgi:hypothetical protein
MGERDGKDAPLTYDAILAEIETWTMFKRAVVLSILHAKSEAKIAAAMAANPSFDHERYGQ